VAKNNPIDPATWLVFITQNTTAHSNKTSGQGVMNTQLTPFSALTPDIILSALDSVGLHSDGRLLALNSYENRVYQVGIENTTAVVTTAAILEEHSFIQDLAESEIPVVPLLRLKENKTLNQFEGFRFSVFSRHSGHMPEIEGREKLKWMGRFIARIHAIGALKPFKERLVLNITNFGDDPRDYLLKYDFIPTDLFNTYSSVTAHALESVSRCFERAGKVKNLRLHGDCYPGNILWTDDVPHFVDFEDSHMGPAIQDLWRFLSGDRTEMTLQLNYLLAGYQTFYNFNINLFYVLLNYHCFYRIKCFSVYR
jgi:Ser/Thr protein kinase RdoA (MazF antagonist)